VGFQEGAEFFLEGGGSVMIGLGLDVVGDGVELGRGDGEGGVAGLPLEG
jgi:hypothetical protein